MITIIQFILLVVIIILAILGNGSVCCLLLRFKTLRTIPNLLVLDLSIVDSLNAIINASLFIAYFVVELEVLHGRLMALLIEISYRWFLFLNLTTKLLLMLDRYFVITHGIRYTAWKSRSKVCLIIALKWLLCLGASVGSSTALWEIDLGDAPVLEYRGEYLGKNGKMIKRLIILINHGLYFCVTVATFVSIRKTNKGLGVGVSKKTEAVLIKANNTSSKVNASKTIGLLVFCDFAFYMPLLLYLYMPITRGFDKHGWFPFFAHYFVFISSVNNPIIYYSRTRRFRMALLKMLRDPCGSSELFELRTLPRVNVVPQHRPEAGRVKNTASSKSRRRQARAALDCFEMAGNTTVSPTLQEQPKLECQLTIVRESGSDHRSSAPIDDFPVVSVHRSASNDDGPESKPFQRQVNVVSSSRRSSRKRKCSAKELKDEEKPYKSESSSNFSSKDNTTQESALSLSEDSQDSYDTWL